MRHSGWAAFIACCVLSAALITPIHASASPDETGTVEPTSAAEPSGLANGEGSEVAEAEPTVTETPSTSSVPTVVPPAPSSEAGTDVPSTTVAEPAVEETVPGPASPASSKEHDEVSSEPPGLPARPDGIDVRTAEEVAVRPAERAVARVVPTAADAGFVPTSGGYSYTNNTSGDMMVTYIQNGQEVVTHILKPGERAVLPVCNRVVDRCEYSSVRMDGSGLETGVTLGNYGEYGAGIPDAVESYSWSSGFGGGFTEASDGVLYVNTGTRPAYVVHQQESRFTPHTVAPGQTLLLPPCPDGLVVCSYTTGTGTVGQQMLDWGDYVPTAGTFVNRGAESLWHLNTGYGEHFHPTPNGVLYTNTSNIPVSVMFQDNFGSQIVTPAAPGQTVALPSCVGLGNKCSYAAAIPGSDLGLLSSAEVNNSENAAGGVVGPETPPVPSIPSIPPRPRPVSSGKPKSENFLEDVISRLGTGIGLGGVAHDFLAYLTKTPSSGVGKAAGVAGTGLGLYEVVRGVQENDDGRSMGGAIDVWAGVVGVTVSAPLGIAASIANMYGQWWAPLGAKQQTEFLNKMAQCKFKKNTKDLTPSQAQYFVKRYSGPLGFGAMLSDYSSSHWPKRFWSC
ncbi:hypothetical protein [Rhodococcus sp. 114MFTsu3.1]|uniref:hypothetical protein n=1 Tax=Rhodococcus sp. 114MFTsu3.1 TaxID=1172184 RepID=UPI0012DCBD1A|nr:hypothetical protein [Rhodococcus sp. 114MFTsu3.1]